MSVRIKPRQRVAPDALSTFLTRQAPCEAATDSGKQDARLGFQDAREHAWYPGLVAHLRANVSVKQLPFRPLAKCNLSDSLVHALCNVLPNICNERSIVSHTSMIWLPPAVLAHREFLQNIVDGLVFVQRVHGTRGPPPTNLLFILAGDPARVDESRLSLMTSRHYRRPFWVPVKQDIPVIARHFDALGIERVGITRVVFDILGRMIPEYKTEFVDKFVALDIDPDTISSDRAATTIRLECCADDPYAIPQEEAVTATTRAIDMFSTVLLNGYCGSGKTVMMIEMIARLRTKTAVLVNKQDLAI